MNVFVSRSREYEFGIAFGYWLNGAYEVEGWSIRFPFAKWSVTFAFRFKKVQK